MHAVHAEAGINGFMATHSKNLPCKLAVLVSVYVLYHETADLDPE
jgi:hypothetical protein